MTDLLKQLRAEHASMRRLLNLLASQIDLIAQAGEVDYDTITDVLDYFLDFPDKCHHPKEDVVARLLIEAVPDRADRLRGLSEMHHDLSIATKRTALTIRGILNEEFVDRAQVARIAHEFIDSQRLHMDMEDQYFFPLAEEILPLADRTGLEAQVFSQVDPMQYIQDRDRFARLRHSLLRIR